MKHQNYRREILLPLDYDLQGLEVRELHGSFADAQWRKALQQWQRDPRREAADRQWTDTVSFRVPVAPQPRPGPDRGPADLDTERVTGLWTDASAFQVRGSGGRRD